MNMLTLAPLSLAVAVLAACRAVPVAQQPPVLPVTRLFGPVVTDEVIRGREEAGGTVWLLAGTASLVEIDLRERKASRVAIAIAAGDACWGLARLTDGSVWTLKGRRELARIESDGRVSRVLPLDEAHIGLFASADRLVYQKALPSGTGEILSAGRPGGDVRPWSALTARPFPGIARAQASALNMVACGHSESAERPCWFPDEAAIALINADGTARRITLSGLSAATPEVLLTAENPPRAVRDAYVDRRGRIWILSSGSAPPGAADRPGGWILARYTAEGIADGQARFAEAVRLILRVDEGGLTVLTGSGHVGEVRAW